MLFLYSSETHNRTSVHVLISERLSRPLYMRPKIASFWKAVQSLRRAQTLTWRILPSVVDESALAS